MSFRRRHPNKVAPPAPAYDPDAEEIRTQLALLVTHPWRALNTFCHEGCEVEEISHEESYLYDYVAPERPPVGAWVAFVCSHAEWGATREEAIAKMITWVRAQLQAGRLGC